MKAWDQPPAIKIYEALGAVADGRVELDPGASSAGAKVYSSTRNKFYTVSYDAAKHAIMANDNGSFWRGYLGYPAIAFLMAQGAVSYDPQIGALLKGIPWKDLNQKYKNDFQRVLEEAILAHRSPDERAVLRSFVQRSAAEIEALRLVHLGQKTKPPEGY